MKTIIDNILKKTRDLINFRDKWFNELALKEQIIKYAVEDEAIQQKRKGVKEKLEKLKQCLKVL